MADQESYTKLSSSTKAASCAALQVLRECYEEPEQPFSITSDPAARLAQCCSYLLHSASRPRHSKGSSTFASTSQWLAGSRADSGNAKREHRADPITVLTWAVHDAGSQGPAAIPLSSPQPRNTERKTREEEKVSSSGQPVTHVCSDGSPKVNSMPLLFQHGSGTCSLLLAETAPTES